MDAPFSVVAEGARPSRGRAEPVGVVQHHEWAVDRGEAERPRGDDDPRERVLDMRACSDRQFRHAE